ncbi:hypothetical protein SteCoe_4425 [Stentor coeruleus]|uniref:Ion transport domain-containing protein n=1 Tax=Stentor coeruleus TaxID=5963 RepID=A0A1R2CUV1_9CILI|nr:hypothetical protein SteCoe_4425 [Stentor coeruleus]
MNEEPCKASEVAPEINATDDFCSVITELEKMTPIEIIPFSFALNLSLSSDRQTITFNTENGIAICSKAKNEVIKSVRITENRISSFAYSEIKSLYYIGDQKGNLHFICSQNLKITKSLELYKTRIQCLVISPDSQSLFSCSTTSEVKMIDLKTLSIIPLYSHNSKPVWCLDITKNGEFLATGGTEYLIFYSITENKIITTLNIGEDSLSCLKFSPDGNHVVTGDDKGNVKIWKVGTYDVIAYAGHNSCVKNVIFGNNCVISGGDDKVIKIWPSNPDLRPIIINTKSGVSDMILDNDVLYVSVMNLITYMKMPNFNTQYVLKKHSDQINQILYSSKRNAIFSISSMESEICMWSTEDFSFITSLQNDGNTLFLCLSADQRYIYVSLDKKIVRRWQIEGEFLSEVFFTSEYFSNSIACTKDNNYVVSIDSTCRCVIRKTLDASVVWTFSNHKLGGLLVEVTHLSNLLITVGSDNTIHIYSINDGKKIGKIEWPDKEASRVRISPDDRLLALSTIYEKVYIWNIEQRSCIYTFTITECRCSDIAFTQDNKYFLIINCENESSQLLFYTLEGFCLMSTMTISNMCLSFQLINMEKYIAFADGSQIYIQENPLKSESLYISSPYKAYPIEFCKYVSDISKGFNTPYQSEMNKYTIFPYYMNILHFYAYFNLTEHLQQALESCNSTIITRSGLEIMSISLQKGLFDNIKIILKYILKNLEYNPYIACFIENSFIELTKESCAELDNFYHAIFFRSSEKSLPKIGETQDLLYKSQYFEVNPLLMLIEKNTESHTIAFYQSALQIYCEIGSTQSINYLESLVSTGNKEIFRSKLVEYILKDKWRQVKWFAYGYALLYLSYLIFLILYVLFDSIENKTILIVINAILVFYEFYQFVLTYKTYLRDVWNLLDVIRLIIFIVYFSLQKPSRIILFFLNLISWARGVTYFRVFTGTRYMVSLLTQVSVDIFAFLVILFYFTVAFTFMNLSLTGSKDDYESFYTIQNTYLLNFGSFIINENDGSWEWLCFVISSMINFLVMVNLLISIIGDTYDKVQSFRDIADRKEMAEMVLEIEYLMIWKRNMGVKKYLHLVTSDNNDDMEDAWQGKVRELQTRMMNIETALKVQSEGIEIKFSELKSDLAEIKEIVSRDNRV